MFHIPITWNPIVSYFTLSTCLSTDEFPSIQRFAFPFSFFFFFWEAFCGYGLFSSEFRALFKGFTNLFFQQNFH